MDCRNHAGTAAAGTCAGCAEPYCANCLVEVRGTRYCASCKTLALTGPAPIAAEPCKEAKEALLYAVGAFFCLGIVLGPVAISKALKAKQLIAKDPALSGTGRANAAIVLGALALVLWLFGMAQRVSGPGIR